jgi:hypothetical protein
MRLLSAQDHHPHCSVIIHWMLHTSFGQGLAEFTHMVSQRHVYMPDGGACTLRGRETCAGQAYPFCFCQPGLSWAVFPPSAAQARS